MVDLTKPGEKQLELIPNANEESVPDVNRIVELPPEPEPAANERIVAGSNFNQFDGDAEPVVIQRSGGSLPLEEPTMITRSGVERDYIPVETLPVSVPVKEKVVLNPEIIPSLTLIVAGVGILIDIVFYFLRASAVAVAILVIVVTIIEILLVSEHRKPTVLKI